MIPKNSNVSRLSAEQCSKILVKESGSRSLSNMIYKGVGLGG